MTADMQRKPDLLDRLLGKPWFCLFFVFIAVRANDLKKTERALAGLHDYDGKECFPFLRVFLWALCSVVLAMYLYRWFSGRVKKKQPMLLCFLGMHAALVLMTLIYRGASGYWLHWTAGLCLMLMLDMGLQCEKKSVLSGFSGALLLWLTLNLPVRLLLPQGVNYQQSVLPQWYIDRIQDVETMFVPEWLLGNRVFYYRLVFPALCLEMIRAQAVDGRYGLRTGVTLALALFTVASQRGGTALIGAALLLGMLLWCNRRALPRYATPAVMLGVSAALFISLQFLHVQNLFGFLIEGRMGKDMSLTDRTVVWTRALQLIAKHPLTGIGLLPVSYMRELFRSTFEQPLNHTHNQLLELLLHGGVLALLPYLGMVAIATRQALRFRRSEAVKTAALLLMVFLFLGTVDIFHNEPIYYPLFMLLAHAEALAEGGKKLPRISLWERMKRDARRARR